MQRKNDELMSIENEIREIIEGLGYDFVGMELVHEQGRMILRIYINTLGGINVKDCETVSRKVDKFL
ncbi:MAG: ribosome maturation factor RimP, partial [Acetomicrobium sp.]|nr:ribosome maturation factor RimP [Acetomicrobium sp.]